MATSRRCAAPVLFLSILTVFLLSCGDDDGPTKPEPLPPLEYGALLTPRGSLEVDPLLSDGYQHLGADGFRVAHLAISWAQIETGQSLRDWRMLDLHINQARQRGLTLSVVLEFIHGGRAEIPSWMGPEFPGWDNPDLGYSLARFLRELGVRSQGTIRYLWLGEGIDRYAAAEAVDEGALVDFISMIADSARASLPSARVGTIINPATIEEDGKAALVGELRRSLDLLGISLEPSLPPAGEVDPASTIARIEEEVSPWAEGQLAILELGYSSAASFGSSEAEQATFASLLAQWLARRPRGLELFCWAPLHDAGLALADSLALRRHPFDEGVRSRYAAWLSSSALRRNDGTPKPGRQRFFEERP